MKKNISKDKRIDLDGKDSFYPDVESWAKFIDEFLFNGNYERAGYFLHVALDMYPESEILLILSGDLAVKLKQLDNAKYFYSEALKFYPNNGNIIKKLEKIQNNSQLTF